MENLPAWITDPINLLAFVSAVFALFLIAICVLQIQLSARLKRLEDLQTKRQKELIKEISLNSPTRAAIAAMIAIGAKESTDLEQFQADVASLTEHWDEIEALAEQAHKKLASLANESEHTTENRARS